uniref:UBZ1-type domain-containing protein n=1 Tax=Anopheles farauti TaxID=69004 RepID=A0A182QNB4_9DIPT
MSIAETRDGSYHTLAASHQALQAALQTLKERCQTLQRRIATLEEENGTLRMMQTVRAPSNAIDQSHEKRILDQTHELEQLRTSVSELTHQKQQMAEQISIVGTENRQLWWRLSLIVKDHAAHRDPLPPHDPSSPSGTVKALPVNHAGQNLIRSRTFTKHAPNPKLRERLPRDGSTDEELINLEDISLLHTCGFLEHTGEGVGTGDCDAPEANPYLSLCTELLLDTQQELALQQQLMKQIYKQLKTELCHRSVQPSRTEQKTLMKDVTVEVAESELLPVAEKRTNHAQQPPQPAPRESTLVMAKEATMARAREESTPPSSFAAATGTGPPVDDRDSLLCLMLQEKLRTDEKQHVCPMCAQEYGPEATFDEFVHHVQEHFLNESDDLSLDRTGEYLSQTVGNF